MLEKLRSKQPKPQVWSGAVVLSIVVLLLFLAPYLGIITLALLLAFIFYPMYSYFLRKFNKNGIAVSLTVLVFFLIVGIPILIVGVIAFDQALNMVDSLSKTEFFVGDEPIEEEVLRVSENINEKIDGWFGIKDAIAQDDITSFFETTLPAVLSAVANLILSVVSGVPSFFTNLIIWLFVFSAGLTKGPELVAFVKKLSPFDKKTNELYVTRIGAMSKAMLKGQFVIAVCQGIVSALVLGLFGFEDYIFIFAIIFTFMSFIPLGAGIVTIPLGMLMIVFGNVVGGIMVLLNHFVIVTNIDNIIRPKLVPKEAQLNPALTILGAFAGVAMFGFIGVIYGPIIIIIVTTTLESYIKYKES